MEDEQVPTQEPIAALEPPEALVDEPEPPVFVPDGPSVVEGEWGGLPNYQCSLCAYDSLERSKTEAHLSIHGKTETGVS